MQTPQTINEYISTFPENIQNILIKINEFKPKYCTECMNYGVPTFKKDWKNFIHFWAFKNHISIFPWPETIKIFEEKLKNYKTSKWSIQFSFKKEIPYDLIKEMIEWKQKENV